MVKIDHKNLTGFLTTKELNRRQVQQAETLAEYYFEIKHTESSNNVKADALSQKLKLQGNKEVIGAILRQNSNGKIRYNYLQLVATSKVLELDQL